VQGSRLLLSEAINNLLDNAIKYHPGGGRIALEVSAGTLAWVHVSDDGPGIPAALHEEALKRFHRVDRSGSDGSGLGLAIVQEIVKSHGGALMLSSGLDGRGLSVRIELPRDAAG
jgi:two-component system sensor histidine kinase TctE